MSKCIYLFKSKKCVHILLFILDIFNLKDVCLFLHTSKSAMGDPRCELLKL